MLTSNTRLADGSVVRSGEVDIKLEANVKLFIAAGEYPYKVELPDAQLCFGEMISIVSQALIPVTIIPSIHDTIETLSSLTLEPDQRIILQSMGGHWLIVSRA